MAIAIDTSVDGGLNNLTWSHTCTGSNLVLLVAFSNSSGATSCTYNGVSMTHVIVGGGQLDVFYLINPATGSHTVSVTAGGIFLRGLSASYTGVSQVGFPDSSNQSSSSSTPLTVNTTVVASNCWLFGAACSQSSIVASISTNKTDRQTGTFSSGGEAIIISDTNGTVGTGSQGITWTAAGGAPTMSGAYLLSMAPVPAAVNGNMLSVF